MIDEPVIDEMEQLEQLCAAVPPPGRERLAAARSQLSTAIAASRRDPAGRARRGPRLAISPARRRRWLGWIAPLAAAAAVTGVILAAQGAFSTIHRPAPQASTHDRGPRGMGLTHPVTAYVSGQSGTVTPILTATGTALPPITIGKGYTGRDASGIVFAPDGGTAYVLSNTMVYGPGLVTPIRTATNTAGKPIAVGQGPRALAITPDGATIYVTNYESGTVTPIRTATDTALAPIKVGRTPWAIAITPDGRTAYVADSQTDTITPIRTATNTALAPIKVGRYPGAIAISPDGRTAYVLCDGTVTPIRTATNTALKPITVPGAFTMTMTPDGKTIYALDLGSSQDQEGTVIPIRTATGTVLKPIPIGHAWPNTVTIAITPDSRTAYVTNANTDTVTPIRTATNTALAPIRLKGIPVGIAITPDGRTAYVIFSSGFRDAGIVTPIRVATNQALSPITVGELPSVIAITPPSRR